MRSQQEQARAEQQRIKNLVLNYDLRDDDPNDGESAFHYVLQPNTNRTRLVGKGILNKSLSSNNLSDVTPVSSSHGKINSSHGVRLQPPPPLAFSAQNENQKYSTHADTVVNPAALDAQSPYNQPRIDKSGSSRNVQRSRKLQLSDVDWYAQSPSSQQKNPSNQPTAQTSLDSYVVSARKQRKCNRRDHDK